MPAKPRWLLAIPDAISQFENLDRTFLTRRDIEQLFGVSTARAATLMQTFGAEMTGNQRTLPRTKLLKQLRKHRARAAFRVEAERRDRRRGARGGGEVPGVLRGADRERADAGGVREGGGPKSPTPPPGPPPPLAGGPAAPG